DATVTGVQTCALPIYVFLSLRKLQPRQASIDTVLKGAWRGRDPVDHALELVKRERLLEQIICAGVERIARMLQAVETSDQNGRRSEERRVVKEGRAGE